MKSKMKLNFKMENAMKRFLILLLALLLFAGAGIAEERPSIVATSFPCYDFMRAVAGDAADVRLLIRPGTEVHTYEPTPKDILEIADAELFVYIGGESDAWVDNLMKTFDSDGPETLKLMDSVSLLEEEDDHGHDELEYDEHIWTSPKNAMKMLQSAADAICEIDPAHAEIYRKNAEEYESAMAELDARLTEIVQNGARNELIFADRFPFLYLAHDYGLSYRAAFNSCTAESEPSAQKMVELIQAIENDHIPVIYTIEMSNGAIARTLADETGAEILNMHSMQTVTQAEFDAGETYITLMRKNLDAIERGLN